MQITENDILSIVQAGEGYNAEFKIRIPSKVKELAEEVCAFANAAGGTLLLGVNDKNEIKGIEINNRKRAAIQQSVSKINPQLNILLYFVNVAGKQVGVIEVPSGTQKPYTLSGAIYIRQGSTSQKITSVEQMRDFFQQSGRIYFDEAGCQQFSFEKDFDNEVFKEFRINAGFSSSTEDLQIINNLKLITEEEHFKNGAVLFFGKSPEEFFDKAVIRCVEFEGDDKVNIIDDKIFGGALINQYYQAMNWLKSKLSVRYVIVGGGPRKEAWEIDETALKEAIINALSHRDYYDKGGRIMIELYKNRIEITNPGGLVSSIPPEEFGSKSSSRNPLIFGLFERIKFVEQVGSGINRIRTLIKNSGLPEPVFKTEGMFTVIFFRKEKSIDSCSKRIKADLEALTKKIETEFGVNAEEFRSIFGVNMEEFRSKYGVNILRSAVLIYKKPEVTAKEIAERLSISQRTAENYLKKLKTNGIIERKGPDKTGYWNIIINK